MGLDNRVQTRTDLVKIDTLGVMLLVEAKRWSRDPGPMNKRNARGIGVT